MHEPVAAAAVPGAKTFQFSTIVIGLAAMLLLRLYAEGLADLLGLVPFLYATAAVVGGICLLRAGMWGSGIRNGVKTVAGMYAVLLLLFAGLWLPALDIATGTALFVPLLFYLIWALAGAPAANTADERMMRRIRAVAPERMATLIAAETRLLAMALFAWGSSGTRNGDMPSFTSASTLGPVLAAILALSLVEMVVLHLILSQWSGTVAWVITGLGVFTFAYIVGLAKSLWYLPSRLQSETLLVRLGHFQSFEIPYRSIAFALPSTPCLSRNPDTLNLAVMSSPNVLIQLTGPQSIVTLAGKPRSFERVALRMDDPSGFLDSLKPRIPAPQAP